MKITPGYAENIIVAIIKNNSLSWYIADKEIWYMDYAKRIKQFEDKGYKIDIEFIDDSRKELLILDVDNIDDFTDKISDYRVETDDLRSYLEKEREINTEWWYNLSPSLYIDFDKKILYSSYREMDSYESYAPKGWLADFKDFLNEIPLESCYWINNNHNYLLESGGKNGE